MNERIIGPLPFWESFEQRLVGVGFPLEKAKNETEMFQALIKDHPLVKNPEQEVQSHLLEMLDRLESQRIK